jgi:hypothetical protein
VSQPIVPPEPGVQMALVYKGLMKLWNVVPRLMFGHVRFSVFDTGALRILFVRIADAITGRLLRNRPYCSWCLLDPVVRLRQKTLARHA